MIIFCLFTVQLNTECLIVIAGSESKTLNYFYKLVLEAYTNVFL